MSLHVIQDALDGVVHVSTGADLPGPRAAIFAPDAESMCR